jgi:DNA-binding XRE family transcriptional regulator
MRESRLLTQQELADRAGVHRVTVASIESGDDAQLSTVRKLAQALTVAAEDLMWQEDARVVRANTVLGPDAATVLKWLINFYRGAAVGQRMSRGEYMKTWASIFPNRQAGVLDSLIRGSFVIESDNGYSLIPAP